MPRTEEILMTGWEFGLMKCGPYSVAEAAKKQKLQGVPEEIPDIWCREKIRGSGTAGVSAGTGERCVWSINIRGTCTLWSSAVFTRTVPYG